MDKQLQDEKQIQKIDSLLKMFSSEYFTNEMLLQYYFKSFINMGGVHDYLTNKLYTLTLQDISIFAPFLCYMLVKHESTQLEKFLSDISATNFPLFLKFYWNIHAYSATDRQLKKKQQRIDKIERCLEMSMVNRTIPQEEIKDQEMLQHFEEKQFRSNYFNLVCKFTGTLIKFSLTLKQFPQEDRKHHLRLFIQKMNVTLCELREKHPNYTYFHGITLPITSNEDDKPKSLMLVEIVDTNYLCFHTRKRVPYQIIVETIDEEDLKTYQPLPNLKIQQLITEDYESQLNDEKLEKQMQQIVKEKQQSYHDALERIMKMEHKGKRQSQILVQITKMVQKHRLEEEEKKSSLSSKQIEISPVKNFVIQKIRRVKSCQQLTDSFIINENKNVQQLVNTTDQQIKLPFSKFEEFHLYLIDNYPQREFYFRNKLVQFHIAQHKNKQPVQKEIWEEVWDEICSKIRNQSNYGHFPSYKLRPIIIKGGDDLRQELLVIQIMNQFQKIFEENSIRLYLRPYNIIVTSANSGIVEFIPNTISIDSLKKKFGDGTKTLYQIFKDIFSKQFEEAQKNFIESLAGYSLFTYLMNIKDRHNGNLLIDNQGHLIHIDFGFVLGNSPGGVNFESAPFKLTQVVLYQQYFLQKGICGVNERQGF